MGYRNSYNRITPLKVRSEATRKFPLPENVKQLKKFLSLINYDRIFVNKLADKLNPLYETVKNSKRKVLRTEDAIKCFYDIKKLWQDDLV